MRRSSIGVLAAAVASLGLASTVVVVSDEDEYEVGKRLAARQALRRESQGSERKLRAPARQSGSIATGNRHSDEPHKHSREVARRLRQQERRA